MDEEIKYRFIKKFRHYLKKECTGMPGADKTIEFLWRKNLLDNKKIKRFLILEDYKFHQLQGRYSYPEFVRDAARRYSVSEKTIRRVCR